MTETPDKTPPPVVPSNPLDEAIAELAKWEVELATARERFERVQSYRDHAARLVALNEWRVKLDARSGA